MKAKFSYQQRGITFLEVLVSMLIIGMALAMCLSMLQTANRFGENAEFSSAATRQAQSIIDKMRANRLAAESYVFTNGKALDPNAYKDFKEIYDAKDEVMTRIPSALKGCNCDNTDAENQARADMAAWRDSLRGTTNAPALLPGAQGYIFSHGNNQYEVLIIWRYNQEADMNTTPAVDGVRFKFAL